METSIRCIRDRIYDAINWSDAPKIFNSRNATPTGYFVPIDLDFEYSTRKTYIRSAAIEFTLNLSKYEGIYLHVDNNRIRTVEGFTRLCDAKRVAISRGVGVIYLTENKES